ncbi:MAG: hypothetical protein UZ14_CFX002002001 [Chloroflexi bacterium OLB14]|nr:MAG: hypothetical protein UZ14_CFX002002001 [Chloroflexi bacterium OLB14]
MTPTTSPTNTPSRPIPTPNYDSVTQSQVMVTETQIIKSTVEPSSTADDSSNTPTKTPISNEWMMSPILPEPSDTIKNIYEYGQSLGNNPNAFSIFGDCQARPAEFFGLYETDEKFSFESHA